MKKIGLSAWAVAFTACYSLSAAPQVNRGITTSIQVNSRRPLAAALTELEKRQGLAITYEDPVYSSPSDIQDVTPARANRLDAETRRILVPKKGSFVLTIPLKTAKRWKMGML
jgi:hypothetical protein